MTDAEPAEHDSLLGTRIDGRYSVLRELGRGGMGVVYEGVHDDLGRQVAIKVLNLAWASDPTAVARFLREARTASSFPHPNIVDVTDLGRLPDGRPYLIMPKVTGTDLAAMLTQSGAQPAKRVAHLLTGVAQALDVIHAKGFVHRDIKPENLMYVVREDGTETVMLLDFGIAAAVMSNEPRLTGQGAIFGTPQFMPPEVCNGGMPDARGDVYALATVAFELITGVLPFGDDNMMRVLTAKLTSDPPSLSEASGVPFPHELEAVIARGLAREPRERFAHASEFISSLQASTENAPVSWRSGVLRPSTRSAAHPVGSHPGAFPGGPASDRPGSPSGRPMSGRPGQSSNPPRGRANDTDQTPSHTQYSYVSPQDDHGRRPSERDEYGRRVERDEYGRPITARDEYGRPIGRGSDRASARDEYGRQSGRDYDPRSNPPPEDHWATRAANSEDPWGRTSPSLGAGLRESERFRQPSGAISDNSGRRIAVLLGVAALLLGFLWYRHTQGLGLDGSAQRPQPPAADARGVPTPHQEPPYDPSASKTQPAQPNAMGYAATEQDAPSQPLNAATAPGALPPSGDAVEHAAATEHAAELGAQAEAQQPSAAGPSDPAAVVPAVPNAAMHNGTASTNKPAHTWSKPQQQPVPSAAAPKPVTPAPSYPAAAPPVPAEPEPDTQEPVLRVEEKEPPPAEEPELPVRSPSSQAAQLAKDASTALLAGEVGHAIELLREATRLDPDQSLAWRTMGLAFERSGDTQAALAAYRQYIRLAPHGPQADMVRERMRVLESQ